jgi:hypothetical protein
VLFEDADDLRFAEPRLFTGGVSLRPVASEFSTYFRGLFRATRHVRYSICSLNNRHRGIEPGT